MEDKISQSFKVQWLNTTLKFIKNDNQMVIEYPQMPIAQVEYLHNLIWQRQNNVGLGFKSLYAPLWEAMRIFSVKYQFQVSVTKATTGEIGQLKIVKIPKNTTEERDKPSLEPNVREMQTRTSPVCEKPIMQPKNINANQESTKVVASNNDEKVKMKQNKLSKGQKYIMHARKIIDSIAPAFFKKTFQKILDFINDESSASYIFSDLAPNEAKFLENFLGIYNRRTFFEVFFSPYCNDLLNKICLSLKEFDKTTKLDICIGKTDPRTCKREIIFLKVPRYTRITSSKAKLTKNTGQLAAGNNGQLCSENETNSSGLKFLKALNIPDLSINDDHNTSNRISNSNSHIIDNTDIETDDEFNLSATDKENVNNNKNTSLVDTETIDKNTNNIDLHKEKELVMGKKSIETSFNETNKVNNVFFEVIEKIENKKEDAVTVVRDTIEKKIVVDNSVDSVLRNMTETKITINNNNETDITEDITEKTRLIYLKDSNTVKIPQTLKSGILFTKSTDTQEVTDKCTDAKMTQSFRKNRLIQAMSTPLESDKAMRMMRLMGWEGGALGLRGEGIIEPIMPVLNIKPGAGLGHVSETFKKKDDKISNRIQLLEAILDLITKEDLSQSILLYNNDLSKKEMRCFYEIIHLINLNRQLSLSNNGENDLRRQINDKMADAQFKLDLIRDSNRKLILNKIMNTETKCKLKIKNEKKKTIEITPTDLNIKSTDITQLPTKKNEFKILILTKVMEFQKDKENMVLNVYFDSIVTRKYRRVVKKLCESVNSKVIITNKQVSYKHLVVELYENLDDHFYDLTFGVDLQSFTIRKVKENPVANVVTKKKKDKTISLNEIKNSLSKISLTESEQKVSYQDKTDAIKKDKLNTDKKDSKDGNKDSNNNFSSKELGKGRSEASSNNSSPTKTKPYILLVETKTKICYKNIVNLITTKINSEIDFPPFLKCHGLQDGYVVYSCNKKKTYLWLKNVLTDYRVIGYRGVDDVYELLVEINVNMDSKKVLSLLETYNLGLNCNEWVVLDVNYFNYSMDFLVQIGFDSYEYIRNNNFILHAGVDDVRFTLSV